MKIYETRALFVFAILVASLTSTAAFAQMPPGGMSGMQEVSGKYTNQEAGVEVDLPSGWSGIAMATGQGTMVTVGPGGMESMGTSSPMMILAVNEKSGTEPSDTDPLKDQGKKECGNPDMSTISVSGVQATQTVVTCTLEDGTQVKIKTVTAQSETSLVAAIFMAPVAEYDGSVADFDSSIQTLKIQGAINTDLAADTTPAEPDATPEPAVPEVESSTMSVMVGGESIDVDIESSAQIRQLTLDEEAKKLSFFADGTQGATITMSVGSVLEGPYTMFVDRDALTDFEVTDKDGTANISFAAEEGEHEVSIVGTTVVPEFPLGLVGLIVSMIGIVAILGRTKLFANLIKNQ